MSTPHLDGVLSRLLSLGRETEWIEWKENDYRPDDIGEYISALSNTAALRRKESGYVIWGVRDVDGDIVGTTFRPHLEKVGNEELENWLRKHLAPPVCFTLQELHLREKRVVLLQVAPAISSPVGFKGVEFIRVGTYKKRLKDHPDKERELWAVFARGGFEVGSCAQSRLR